MSDDIEARAKEMGWKPQPVDPENPQKNEFRGNPEKWVPAEEYVARGEQILPIVRSYNQQLREELMMTNQKLQAAEQLQRQTFESMQALKEAHEEDVKREVERTKKRLRAELIAARKDGDTEVELAIQEELDTLPTAAAPKKEEPKPEPAKVQQMSPDFIRWQAQNNWYGVDPKRTALANAIGLELRNDPLNNNLVGTPFWDKVAEEVENIMSPRSTKTVPKVEGNNFSGSGGGGVSRKKGYKDLPADARAVCDKQSVKLVGEGRAFKTKEEHDAHYAAQYFRGDDE